MPGCPLKEMCHRFTAPAGVWQSYFTKPPVKDNKCDMFWGQSTDYLLNYLNDIVNGKK